MSLPPGSAGTLVLSTVVVVLDANGHVVTRIELKVRPGQDEVEVTVPFVADGYTVKVYTANDLGVSPGAPRGSALSRAPTVAPRSPGGIPRLLGTALGPPIVFNAGSTWLDPRDRQQLDRIVEKVRNLKSGLLITGFARAGSNQPKNMTQLSTARARAVAEYLANKGVRLWIKYWGASDLHGRGGDSDRRVEIRTSSAAIPRSLVP